ncbi:Pentatricopeptide repeat [Quillaja saponaria]|uniref:Pentatricopeptide repeat n=1 Tax=Quillaja saponaria TaxID=32244 RepID=A0AAD7Q298_QUISA|nr:Pentatricopeptide repeat [Quillaja saponaria]
MDKGKFYLLRSKESMDLSSMVTSNTHLSPLLLPLSIQKFQHFTPSSTFKFTQIPPKETHLSNTSPTLHQLQPNLEETEQIHAHLIKTHFDTTHQVPFKAIQSYSSKSSTHSFLITSYIKNNHPENALQIYSHMRKTETEVDNFTIPSVLKACGLISWIILGKEIHGFVVKNGMDKDVFVCNALIHMYSEGGSFESARFLFDKMAKRDDVTWSTMIRSYVQSRLLLEALEFIRQMHAVGVKPSEIAMISMVNLSADLADIKLGKTMHAYVLRNSNHEKLGVPLTTSLIDMYAKCVNLAYARRLFDGLSQANIVSWTTMIAGYIRCNDINEGVRHFVKMLGEGIFPNEVTVLSLVTVCGSAGALGLGKQLHAYFLRNGSRIPLALETALVDMYGKCGDVKSARALFNSIPNKDVMMWSVMLSAYAKANSIDQAFNLFTRMTSHGIRPNEVTMVSLLSLCAEAGALDMGKWIHAYLGKQGIKTDMILRTSLVDMYAKCGDIDGALGLFREATERDICMWNTMMAGFAVHGCGEEALELFSEMERVGVIPNDITFIGALHACSHAGMVVEGKRLFQKMTHGFSLIPKVEHYGCMVDLLGRAGLLKEAQEVISSMPMRPNIIIWGSLLAACKLHKNLNLGEWIARQFVVLDPKSCGYNVMMSNIYAAANRWSDVTRVRHAMKVVGIKKEPGISSIEVNGSVHEFAMGDKTHPETGIIYNMIAEMTDKLRDGGYTPNTSAVLLNIDEEEKETKLRYHSEKLAMAFGLIKTAPGVPIRIVKNLRVCDDCHNVTKLLSKIYGRVIIVRDRNRFHHFKEGSCSCGDYW